MLLYKIALKHKLTPALAFANAPCALIKHTRYFQIIVSGMQLKGGKNTSVWLDNSLFPNQR